MAQESIDWLGAAAEAAKGLPGGQFLIAPLLRIRDDQKLVRQRAALREAIRKNREVTMETLQHVLQLEGQVNETKIALKVLAPLVNQMLRTGRRKMSSKEADQVLRREFHVTGFPLPLSQGLLIEELDALFPTLDDMGDLKTCLAHNDYPIPEAARSGTEFNTRLVKSMTGKPTTLLASVFACLHEKRAASMILAFAWEYLASTTEMTEPLEKLAPEGGN